MKKIDIDNSFEQLKMLNIDLPFEVIISWVYHVKQVKKVNWWQKIWK